MDGSSANRREVHLLVRPVPSAYRVAGRGSRQIKTRLSTSRSPPSEPASIRLTLERFSTGQTRSASQAADLRSIPGGHGVSSPTFMSARSVTSRCCDDEDTTDDRLGTDGRDLCNLPRTRVSMVLNRAPRRPWAARTFGVSCSVDCAAGALPVGTKRCKQLAGNHASRRHGDRVDVSARSHRRRCPGRRHQRTVWLAAT